MLNNLKNINIKKLSLWLSVTALACFAIAALLFFQIDMKDFMNNKYQYDVNEQKNFETKKIKDINIDSFSSDINVIEYDADQVKVHIYGKLYSKYKKEENKPVIELVDGRLDIKENRKSAVNIGINFNIGQLFQSNEMRIDLFIPKGYKENMKIDSSSGNVKADSLNLKAFDINTFSGDIELKDVTADTFKLETSSGNIKTGNVEANDIKVNTFSGNGDCKNINAGKVNLESSSGGFSFGTVEAEKIIWDTFSGDISADGIKSDDININTSSGNIRSESITSKKIKCKTFSGDIELYKSAVNSSEIETSSGNVTLKLLEGSEFTLEADSSSGNVTCDYPMSYVEKQDEHEIKGSVGKNTGKIYINTFSGGITVGK